MLLWQFTKFLSNQVSFSRRVRLLAALLPSKYWFRGAVVMSRWHAGIASALGNQNPGLCKAWMLENFLIELSKIGPFPVPLQINDAELLAPLPSDKGGIILCGTHVPFLRMLLRAAILSGHRPELAVGDASILSSKYGMQATGLNDGIPAVSPGPVSLLRIRSILRRNGLVACTLDSFAGGKTHPDLLVLAGHLGARIVTYRTNLEHDGTVTISFSNAIHPYCNSDQAIEENMDAIRKEQERVFAVLEGRVNPSLRKATLATMTVQEIPGKDHRKEPISSTSEKIA
ncbi:MAG TPA: hypothetical protein VFE38_15050 [Edaphobacter sp.]|nr:hypothetical protein [Edaphobacter sp.]